MTFNSWTFIFEVVNFLVLAYILQRLLYRPLHEAVDRRRQTIESAQAEAESARRQAEEQRRTFEGQAAAMAQERQAMLQVARLAAEAEREQILADVGHETERRAALARESLERERQDVLHSLQHDLIRDATRLAERLVSEVSDDNLDAHLVRRLADTVRSVTPAERDKLVQSWATDDTAILETARGLTPKEVEPVHEAVSQLLGHDIALELQERPELLSGVRLRIEGQTWDASLAGQMEGVGDGYASVRT